MTNYSQWWRALLLSTLIVLTTGIQCLACDYCIAEDYADQYGLSHELVFAIIQTESSWNANATNGIHRGLMQLSDSTGAWCAEQLGINYEPYNPICNINCGCYYLSTLIADWEQYMADDAIYYALGSYNYGTNGLNRWLANNSIKDNAYVNKVMQLKVAYEGGADYWPD